MTSRNLALAVMLLAYLVLPVAKLCHLFKGSWWWAFAPFWITAVAGVVVVLSLVYILGREPKD